MSVDITIQETVNEVDITVNQNVITVNVIRTTGGGGVESINGETGVVVLTTDNVNEGLINLYFTAARVRATVLTGISFVSGIAITATDTILSAFGKLQKQISSLGAVAFSNNYNDLDNKPTIPSPQNLTQVLTQGDLLSWFEPFPSFPANSFITIALGRELTDNFYDTQNVGTGGLFLDKDIIFPENSTIRFQAGYVEDNPVPSGVTLPPYRFTTDAYVFYQGTIVTDITLQPEDVCTLKYAGYNGTDGIQIWFLTVVSKSSGGSGTVTNVSGTTNEITVSSPTTTPVIGISSTYTSARDTYADAKVADNLTASTTVAPSKTAVNTALDLKVDETSWVDYSASSTIIGWSSFTNKKISYIIIGNIMIVDFNLEGTSNASTISFTIPSNSAVFSFILSAYIINNGAASSYAGRISTASGSNVVTVQRDGQNTAFTASGTKRCSGQIIIQL